jgi:hypothetical protein
MYLVLSAFTSTPVSLLATSKATLFFSNLSHWLLTQIPGVNSYYRGTRWRSSLRHCATNRKVAGSIPDGGIGIFHRYNPSGRSMALGLTQPLTEMSKW